MPLTPRVPLPPPPVPSFTSEARGDGWGVRDGAVLVVRVQTSYSYYNYQSMSTPRRCGGGRCDRRVRDWCTMRSLRPPGRQGRTPGVHSSSAYGGLRSRGPKQGSTTSSGGGSEVLGTQENRRETGRPTGVRLGRGTQFTPVKSQGRCRDNPRGSSVSFIHRRPP